MSTFGGGHCEIEPCQNGGVCLDYSLQAGVPYTCSCLAGWTGTNCETDAASVASCNSQPCKNGGVCTDINVGFGIDVGIDYICTCQNGWAGTNCDSCLASSCMPTSSSASSWLPIAIAVPISVIVLIAIICLIIWFCRKCATNEGQGTDREGNNIPVTKIFVVGNSNSDVDITNDILQARLGQQNQALDHPTVDYRSPSNETNRSYPGPRPPVRPVEASSITRDQLRFIRELGSGQYGVVRLAETLINTPTGVVTKVAVKSTKEGAPQSEKDDLLKEFFLMQKFKPHPNVVQLVGGCFDQDPYYVILEYVEKGELLKVLKDSRRSNSYLNDRGRNENNTYSTFSEEQLMKFALQVTNGMDFITSYKCVHRDLAARNVLVSESLVCKVGDFGLARETEEYTVSNRALPLRWMATESLFDGVHTKQSDVWSFGILLWEIVTLGTRPYPMMGTDGFRGAIQQGYRMPQPRNCSQEIYNIMLTCWSSNPAERPSFSQLSRQIGDIIDQKKDYLILEDIEDDLYDDTAVIDRDERV